MKMKFILIGPKGSGKTLISNHLAEQKLDFQYHSYRPTSIIKFC